MSEKNPKLFERQVALETPDGRPFTITFTDITLRDLFAMAALAGGLANGNPRANVPAVDRWAAAAYVFADAMLAERAKVRP